MVLRVLDTNIVSYEIKGHTLAKKYARHTVGYQVVLSFQTVAELLEWATVAGWGPKKRAELEQRLATAIIIDSDRLLCDHWAEVRAIRRGHPIDAADAWIAATALAYGLELVTHNPADFAGIPHLSVISEAP